MSKKTYRKDDDPPSEIFVNALYGYGVGSSELTCNWCDRLHLCPESESYLGDDDGGLGWKNYCEEEHKNNPEGVVLHYDCDAVSGQTLNNIQFVLGCPCNGLSRYEKFIWAERDTIRRYLKSRIDSEYEFAQQEKTKNKLAGIDATDDKTEEFWRGY